MRRGRCRAQQVSRKLEAGRHCWASSSWCKFGFRDPLDASGITLGPKELATRGLVLLLVHLGVWIEKTPFARLWTVHRAHRRIALSAQVKGRLRVWKRALGRNRCVFVGLRLLSSADHFSEALSHTQALHNNELQPTPPTSQRPSVRLRLFFGLFPASVL